MNHLFAQTVVAFAAMASAAAMADPSSVSGAQPQEQCATGYVTGVGGSAQSMREYLATPARDRYRYLADNAIQCQVSDEGRTSGCTGVIGLRHERVSIYDTIDDTLMAVVARVELDRGTYPAIIVVQKQDVRCEE